MVVQGTCPDQSCVDQLRMYHARHQSSLCFPKTTNVGHEPSQGSSTLNGFGSRDLQEFAEAKPSIQLHSQVNNASFPLNLMFAENNFRVLEGSPVSDQQSHGLFRGHFQASAIQPTLCPQQTFINSQLQDSDVLNAFRMSMLISAQNPLRLPVPLFAIVAMSNTAWVASTLPCK